MHYDFDKITDRKNTNSLKYDFAAEFHRPADVLPMWVADMDFPAPPEVIEALKERAVHGIFGYTETKTDYFESVSRWFRESFSWRPKEEWMIKTPGVVFAIAAAVRGFTRPGDSVLIQTPVYYPFAQVIAKNGRQTVRNSLHYEEGKYTIDFNDFEQKIRKHQVKLFVLCSPHNPVGRVWSREELSKMGEICQRWGVIVVSDEIHCDFTYHGHTHHVYASLGEAFQEQSVICTAPSKTFNLAGLQASHIFIANPELRAKFKDALSATGYGEMNTMAVWAAKAAYDFGRPWLKALKVYLVDNQNYMRDFLRTEMPQLHMVEPEGTYLVWLDCHGLGLSDKELNERVLHQAKLWLDKGTMFGEEGENFQRFNIACPRKTLAEAMERFKKIM